MSGQEWARKIRIVTPAATPRAGNRATAERWAAHLRKLGHETEVDDAWEGASADLLVAIHARKSHASAARWRRRSGSAPLIVALPGTDLYRDLAADPNTRESLLLADRLIVLQQKGVEAVPSGVRPKARVIHPSAPDLWAACQDGASAWSASEPSGSEAPGSEHSGSKAAGETAGETAGEAAGEPPAEEESAEKESPEEEGAEFQVAVLAHLRTVKDPLRAAAAARLLPDDSLVRVIHCGEALSLEWERAARDEMARNPRYLWLGDLARSRAMSVLRQSRLLAVTSELEGGCNAVCEAVTVGIPILASHVPGLVGMLGENHPGFFRVGETAELAALIHRAETDPGFYRSLGAAGARRAPLFDPARERSAWRSLLDELLPGSG